MVVESINQKTGGCRPFRHLPDMKGIIMNQMQKFENVIIKNDLKDLTEEEKLKYYKDVCTSLGLNPLTHPLGYIPLNNKLTLYAKRDCTDQLRKLHNVSIVITSRTLEGDIYSVTAQASIGNRTDESIGAVGLGTTKGDARANLMMKAETKAKRRATLSICGLGLLDETEVETVNVHDNNNTKQVVQAAPKTESSEFVLPPERIEQVKRDAQRLMDEDAVIRAVDAFPGATRVESPSGASAEPINSIWYNKQKELNNKPTEKQIKMIGGLVKEIRWSNEVAANWLRSSYGVGTREELTRKQASSVIEALMAIRDTGEPDYGSAEVPDELRDNEADI